jgi:uncharacterized protein
MNKKKIWIDLDNSPHVPLFKPIIDELKRRGYSVLVTVRDNAQTCGLADLFALEYKKIGHFYGKRFILKFAGLVIRSMELMPTVLKEKPQLALSHGSRSQHLLALMLRIPTIIMMDYEHVTMLPFSDLTRILTPEAIPRKNIKVNPDHIIHYPGIKEDVYIPAFEPDGKITEELGLKEDDIVVTMRPPATEAHYHNPESETIFNGAVDFLGVQPKVRMVILPRNDKQTVVIRDRWSALCAAGKIIIPDHVIDGLNMLWYSDLAISGGGTMNREAAALGVPVYSVFKGKIGAVDRYLSSAGRLTLITNPEELERNIVVAKRNRPPKPEHLNRAVLKAIVDGIVDFVEKRNGRLG